DLGPGDDSAGVRARDERSRPRARETGAAGSRGGDRRHGEPRDLRGARRRRARAEPRSLATRGRGDRRSDARLSGASRAVRETRRLAVWPRPMPREARNLDVLPPLYARWASEFLTSPIAAEKEATCGDCAMLCGNAAEPGSAARRGTSIRR